MTDIHRCNFLIFHISKISFLLNDNGLKVSIKLQTYSVYNKFRKTTSVLVSLTGYNSVICEEIVLVLCIWMTVLAGTL